MGFADVKSLVLVIVAAKAGRGVWFRRRGTFAVPWSSRLLTFFIQQGTEYRGVPRWLASWGPRDGTFLFVLQGISLAHRRPISDVMPRVRYIRNPTSRLSRSLGCRELSVDQLVNMQVRTNPSELKSPVDVEVIEDQVRYSYSCARGLILAVRGSV
jgi:hypothetical protein